MPRRSFPLAPLLCLLIIVCALSDGRAASSPPSTSHAAAPMLQAPRAAASDERAAAYLDRRARMWLEAPPYAGQKVACATSCHTTVFYLPARAKLAGSASMLPTLTRRIAERVDAPGAWRDQKPFFGESGSAAAKRSLGTEAVLNALTLSFAAPDAPLTERAFERLWEAQRPDGSWLWLDFDQEPWEADNVDWGAALAALAVANLPPAERTNEPAIAKLRGYLRARLARGELTLHDQLFLAWADHEMGGAERWLTEAEWSATVALLRARRHAGTWSLRALLHQPDATDTDGYATAVATMVLCLRGSDPSLWRPALAWLDTSQRDDGAWPARAISADHTSIADLHLRDAATAFAVLARESCQSP